MLTPEQLEAAARKLCEIRGIDPNERRENETKHDEFISTTVAFLAWEECADEIRVYLEIQEAVQSVPQPSPRIVFTIKTQHKPVSICVCGHNQDCHKSDDGPTRCAITDCLCDWFTEDTGATIEANKQPRT